MKNKKNKYKKHKEEIQVFHLAYIFKRSVKYSTEIIINGKKFKYEYEVDKKILREKIDIAKKMMLEEFRKSVYS